MTSFNLLGKYLIIIYEIPMSSDNLLQQNNNNITQSVLIWHED